MTQTLTRFHWLQSSWANSVHVGEHRLPVSARYSAQLPVLSSELAYRLTDISSDQNDVRPSRLVNVGYRAFTTNGSRLRNNMPA